MRAIDKLTSGPDFSKRAEAFIQEVNTSIKFQFGDDPDIEITALNLTKDEINGPDKSSIETVQRVSDKQNIPANIQAIVDKFGDSADRESANRNRVKVDVIDYAIRENIVIEIIPLITNHAVAHGGRLISTQDDIAESIRDAVNNADQRDSLWIQLLYDFTHSN